jgi:MHS family proline/betaine transporter-like MFS transporter
VQRVTSPGRQRLSQGVRDGTRSQHGRVVIAATVGTFVEYYDITLYGILAVYLARHFFPQGDPTAALLATFAIYALGFAVRPIGAIIFGHLGDRIGRRPVLATSLLLMTAATAAIGVLPTYSSVGLLAPALLIGCRLVQGLSASAELPGANLMVMESAPHQRRARAVAITTAQITLGGASAILTGLILATVLSPAQLGDWGWRLAFLAAAPVGLIGLYIRNRLPDSPMFLALTDRERRDSLPLVRTLRTAKRQMVLITVWLAAVYLCAALVGTYLPNYLIREVRLTPADTYTASLITSIIAILSTLVTGYLIDRFHILNRIAVVVMAGFAITALPGFWIISRFRTLPAVVVGQGMWVVFLGAGLTVSAVLTITLFPIAIRFTGTALAINLGSTLFGSTAPYVSATLVATTHNPQAPGYYLLATAVVGLLVAILGLPRLTAHQRPADQHTPQPE